MIKGYFCADQLLPDTRCHFHGLDKQKPGDSHYDAANHDHGEQIRGKSDNDNHDGDGRSGQPPPARFLDCTYSAMHLELDIAAYAGERVLFAARWVRRGAHPLLELERLERLQAAST